MSTILEDWNDSGRGGTLQTSNIIDTFFPGLSLQQTPEPNSVALMIEVASSFNATEQAQYAALVLQHNSGLHHLNYTLYWFLPNTFVFQPVRTVRLSVN